MRGDCSPVMSREAFQCGHVVLTAPSPPLTLNNIRSKPIRSQQQARCAKHEKQLLCARSAQACFRRIRRALVPLSTDEIRVATWHVTHPV